MAKIIRQYITFIFLMFFTAGSMSAEYKFRTFDISDGLADNSVRCIGQDKDGYMWIGTRNGLSRFDGREFVTYRYKDGEPSYVASNDINALLVDGDSIWIGSSHGLFLFDIHTHEFAVCSYLLSNMRRPKVFDMSIKDIIRVKDTVYVLSNDRCIYKKSGNKLYTQIDFKQKNWYSICSYFDKYILAHGYDGLSLIDPVSGSVLACASKPASGISIDLFFDEKKKTAFVSYGLTEKTKTYHVTGDNRIVSSDVSVLPCSDLTSCYEGNILFGTNGGGLIADEGNSMKVYDTSGSSISGDVITSIFTDNDKNLWVGTYRYGLNLYSPRFGWISALSVSDKGLSHRLATALALRDSVLYVGTDGGGMDRIDFRTNSKTNYRKSGGGIVGDAVLSMIEDDEYLWMGCYADGLSRYDFKTGTFQSYPYKEESIWSIADDGIDHIWVIGKDVSLFDKSTESFQKISGLERIWASGVKFVGDEAWIYTSAKGIYVVDMSSMTVNVHYGVETGMPSDAVPFMYVDSHNNKWIGFLNNGLYVSEAGKPFNEVQRVEGLEASNIMTMVEHEGYIWVATDNGLFRYDSRNNHFSRYGKEDGLGSVQFLNCSYASEGGRFYFGTTQGVVEVDVNRIKYGAVKPVHINSLTLIHNDSTIFVYGKDSPVVLAHDENFFSVRFSQPELVSPGKMSFSCRLKGFDKEWRNLDDSREAVYTNVPPGHYTFEVRSKDWDGSWCESYTTLNIDIRFPWYRKWWAVMIWVMLFVAVFYGCLYAYSYKRLIRKRFRMKLRDAIGRIQESGRVRAIEIREMESATAMPEENRLMTEVIASIENNISDSGYSIDDLSRDVSVSRTKLYKIIQDETGRTPAVLIREIRLKQSSRLLSSTDFNISEISVMVGFGSLKYFNKYFKEMFGVTPSTYRENQRNGHQEK